MKIKSGFTLAEVMITVGIIGIIAAVTIPALINTMPNQELIMFKKAYYNTSRIVAELINDDDLYPDIENEDNPDIVGFAITNFVEQLGLDSEARYQGQDYEGTEKFCGLFAAKLNASQINCADSGSFSADNVQGNFTTTDGIAWAMPVADFQALEYIIVDVNGQKGNNCVDGETYNVVNDRASECNDGDTPDEFAISVDKFGHIEAIGDVAKEYIRTTRTSQSYRETVNCLANNNCR